MCNIPHILVAVDMLDLRPAEGSQLAYEEHHNSADGSRSAACRVTRNPSLNYDAKKTYGHSLLSVVERKESGLLEPESLP